MKLYHCKNARSLRPLWALEELGIDYELVNMAFPPRASYPGYLTINPLGTVPTLTDGDLTLTESSGICQYLAETRQPNTLRVDPSEPAYGDYINWLFRSDATLTFPQTIVLRYSQLEPEARRIPQAVEDYSVWYLSRLRSVESALQDGREFLCADRFTMADISCVCGFVNAKYAGWEPDAAKYPALTAWIARTLARPSFAKALDADKALFPGK